MIRNFRKLFKVFWCVLDTGKSPKRRTPLRNRLTAEPLEERWLPDAHNLLWIAPVPPQGQQANWTDSNGNNFIPQNGDSLVFDPNQNWGGKQGVNTASTDDITLSLVNFTVKQGFGSTITLSQTLTITGQGTQESGTLTSARATNDLIIASVNRSTGSYAWSGGTMASLNLGPRTQIQDGASMTISGAATKTLNNRWLENRGVLTWSGAGDIQLQNHANIDNYGTFNAKATSASATDDGTGSMVINEPDAIFDSTPVADPDGFMVTMVKATFINDGVANVNAGDLALFNGSGTIGDGTTTSKNGKFVIANGSRLRFEGSAVHTLDGALITGTGYAYDWGDVETLGTVNVDYFQDRGGDLATKLEGSGTLVVHGTYIWNGASWTGGKTQITGGAFLNIPNAVTTSVSVNGRTLDNYGTVTWSGNMSMSYSNGAAINNYSGALFDIQVNQPLSDGGGAGQFTNSAGARVRKSAGTGVATVGLPFLNNGGDLAIQQRMGTIDFTKKLKNVNGSIEANQGTTIVCDAGFQQDGGNTTIASSSALTVTGSVAENAGRITLGDGRGGGTLSATAGTQVASGAVFSGYATITGDITNAGEVDFRAQGASSGTLNLTGNYSQTGGTTSVFASMTFAGTGTYTQTGGTTSVAASDNVSFGGAFAVNGGTFNLGDPSVGANLDVPAGLQVGSSGVFAGSGSIYGAVTTAGEFDAPSGPLSVTGTYTQTAGTTTVHGNGLSVSDLVDVRGGYFNMVLATVGALNGMQIDTGATLEGAGHITVAGNLTNAGLIDIEGGSGFQGISGILTVTGNYTQTSSGVLNVHLYSVGGYDALQVSGLATLGGTLNVFLGPGYTPSPGDVFAVLTYGSRSGTFATVNLPSLPRGHWDPRYDDASAPNELTLWVLP
jgi:hypothetical protein